jgi:hypothetical protein
MVLSSEPISKKTPVQAKNNPTEVSRLMAKISAEQNVLDRQREAQNTKRPPQPIQAATRLTANPRTRSKSISVAPQKSGSAKISVRPVRGENNGLSLLGSAALDNADSAVTLDELVI